MKNIKYINGSIVKSRKNSNRPVDKRLWSSIKFIKTVVIWESDIEKFIQEFGWNENIRIGNLYLHFFIENQQFFARLKCKVVVVCWFDNKFVDIELLKNIQTIIFRWTGDQRLIDYMNDLYKAGIRVRCGHGFVLKLIGITDELYIMDDNDITHYNRDARKIIVNCQRIIECFEYFRNIEELSLHIHINDVFDIDYSILPNLKVLSIIPLCLKIDDTANKTIVDIVEKSKNLRHFNCHRANEIKFKFTVNTFRDHPRLREISTSNNKTLYNNLLREAKKLDREYRYRYIKVCVN